MRRRPGRPTLPTAHRHTPRTTHGASCAVGSAHTSYCSGGAAAAHRLSRANALAALAAHWAGEGVTDGVEATV